MNDILITGDGHNDLISNSFIEENGIERSINESFAMLDYMIDYAINKKIKAIIFNGDMFDTSKPLPDYYEMMISRLNKIEFLNGKIKLFWVKGNHEASNSRKSALAPISKIQYSNISIVEDICTFEILGIPFVFVPHITKSQVKEGTIEEYILNKVSEQLISNYKQFKKKSIISGHLHYKNAEIGSESIILRGGINFFPDVDKKLVSKIFLAHIHKRQILKYGNIEIFYSGSTTKQDFGERKDDKGFLVYDSIKDEVNYEDLPCTQLKQINIDFVNKNTIELDSVKIKKSCDGKIIKIVFDISEDNKNKVNTTEIIDEFSKYCYVAKVEKNIIKKEKKKIKIKNYTPIEAFKNYVSKNVSEEDKEDVLNKGKDILEKLI